MLMTRFDVLSVLSKPLAQRRDRFFSSDDSRET